MGEEWGQYWMPWKISPSLYDHIGNNWLPPVHHKNINSKSEHPLLLKKTSDLNLHTAAAFQPKGLQQKDDPTVKLLSRNMGSISHSATDFLYDDEQANESPISLPSL